MCGKNSETPKICFRVDASNSTGMGHMSEALALSASFEKRGCKIYFFTKDTPPAKWALKGKGWAVGMMPEGAKREEELKMLSIFLKENGIDVLICDPYEADNGYFLELKKISKMLVVILDNSKMQGINADLAVNFSISQDEGFYKKIKEGGAEYLIGPKYMPLSQSIAILAKKKKAAGKECKKIFVNQGGSDPFELTKKIILALEKVKLGQEIYVVVGPAVLEEHRKGIRDMQGRLKNKYIFEWDAPAEKMQKIMAECDMAITAAGNTLYELAALGMPCITICHHERHNEVAELFARRGAALNLGVGTKLDDEKIAQTAQMLANSYEMRLRLSKNIRKVTDGNGCEKIADETIKRWKKLREAGA